jgi:hypothetical protein
MMVMEEQDKDRRTSPRRTGACVSRARSLAGAGTDWIGSDRMTRFSMESKKLAPIRCSHARRPKRGRLGRRTFLSAASLAY